MTAELIELRPGLKRLPLAPESLRGRAKDAVLDAYAEAHDKVRGWCAKSPVLIVRRRQYHSQVRNAFEIGRDSVLHSIR